MFVIRVTQCDHHLSSSYKTHSDTTARNQAKDEEDISLTRFSFYLDVDRLQSTQYTVKSMFIYL